MLRGPFFSPRLVLRITLVLALFQSVVSHANDSGWALCDALADLAWAEPCPHHDIIRRELPRSLVQYSVVLRVGPHPQDLIGVHRIIREVSPGIPMATPHAVLMVHGSNWSFNAIFNREENSAAQFLAVHGVDVWGIDLRWVQVPEDTSDFSFMADWDIATHIQDIEKVLEIARRVRLLTGSRSDKMHVLGWSLGSALAYAYANAETQAPPERRHLKGLIPVDFALKSDPARDDLRQAACNAAAIGREKLDNGVFHSEEGQLLRLLGGLAQTAPDQPSPIFSNVTNDQAALLSGAATYLLFPPHCAPHPDYHLAAGLFASTGVPLGLRSIEKDAWFDFLQTASPYGSYQEMFEAFALTCDELDLPYDDYLDQITVPVLYLGAQGGYGNDGIYTTTLLGSDDISMEVINLAPPDMRILDYGHADLWIDAEAKLLIWRPLLIWILRH